MNRANLIIANNTFKNISNSAISILGYDNVSINNNNITVNGLFESSGISVGYGSNNHIFNNKIISEGSHGIATYNSKNKNKIYNNFITIKNSAFRDGYGIYISART